MIKIFLPSCHKIPANRKMNRKPSLRYPRGTLTFPTSSRKCTWMIPLVMKKSDRRDEKPLGKIFDSHEKDSRDSYIVKVSTKRYLISFSDITINLRAALSSLKSSGSSSTKQYMDKFKPVSFSSIEYGKTYSTKRCWRINIFNTFLATFLSNKGSINNHKLIKINGRQRINTY